jgi:YhcH/YjgK/YiaL family protein
MRTETPEFIIDDVSRLRAYAALHPGFARAAGFLETTDVLALAPGRYEIDGPRVVAIVDGAAELVPPGERRPEFHRRFFDIQVPLTGEETYGLARLDPAAARGAFDDEKDIGFLDQPVRPYTLRPGQFAILFPDVCAHAPACSLTGRRTIRKIVFKVLR